MGYFKQGWIGVVGDVIAFGPLIWRYAIRPLLGLLSLGGDVDFVLEHVTHRKWVAILIENLAHPVAQFIVLALGLTLIYFDRRRQIGVASHPVRGLAKMGPIILVWIGAVAVMIGLTWVYLDYRSSQKEIASALRRYVLPRHLSEEQVRTMAAHFKEHGPFSVKFAVDKNNNEATSYANDFRRAFQIANWPIMSAVDRIEIEGISSVVMQPQGTAWEASKNPGQIFRDATVKAGMAWPPIGSGAETIEAGEPYLVVRIGKRYMSDNDLEFKKQQRERAQKMLRDFADD